MQQNAKFIMTSRARLRMGAFAEKRKCFRRTAWRINGSSGLFAGFLGLLLLSGIAATAQNPPSGITFSRPVPDLYPNEPFVTCLIGNFEEPSRIHHWKLLFRGSGLQNVNLTVVATTVNTAETGAIKATVVDQNGPQTLSVPFPNSQGDNMGSLPLTVNGGQIYDLILERIEPPSGPGAHHYKLGSPDKRLELGWEDPLRYLEHEGQVLVANADSNENVSLDIFTDPPAAAGANQATAVTVNVKRPDCSVVFPSTQIILPGTISIANYSGGTLVIDIENADGHFRMRKNSGMDRGFYALPCPPPPKINCPANLVVSTDPDQCGAVATFAVTAVAGCDELPVICMPPSGSNFPIGTTTVVCRMGEGEHSATCSFTVTVVDKTPPLILCPPDLVVHNDPGQCGAVVKYAPAKAFDNCGPVEIKCEPPSGSVFPKGTTIVICTAVDAAGNSAGCSFTVTVNDVEAPVAECAPTTNPDGRNIPKAGENPKSGRNPDGFYQLSGGDNCDGPGIVAVYVKDSASDFVAGPFKDGDKVKITQAPGVTPNQKKMAGVIVAHIQLNGDALLYAVDSSGNVSQPHLCLVPPKPK